MVGDTVESLEMNTYAFLLQELAATKAGSLEMGPLKGL